MKPIQLADPGFARKARSDAAEWRARTKAKLAVLKIARGRFTKRDIEYDVLRGEIAIGVWLREWGHWRFYKFDVSNALNFEFEIDTEVSFARLSRAIFNPRMLVFDFDKVMRVTVGISEIPVSCVRTNKIRSDWALERRTLPLKPSPPIPTT